MSVALEEKSAETNVEAPSGETTSLTTLDIMGLLECLPHRYPFLMVDRIVDIRGEEGGVGIKNVTINEPQFLGHFPGTPIMPGVLLIEGMAQTAGALTLAALRYERPQLVYLMSIDKVKFRKPVYPGDTVEYHMQQKRRRGQMWRFAGECRVKGVVVAEAEITAMIVRK